MTEQLTHPLLKTHASAPKISSILVWAGLGEQAAALTRLGVRLANMLSARLIGVSIPSRPATRWDTAIEQDAEQRLIEAAGEQFREAAAAVRAGMVWRRSEGPLVYAARKLTWATDMVVTNLEGCGWEEDGVRCDAGTRSTDTLPCDRPPNKPPEMGS